MVFPSITYHRLWPIEFFCHIMKCLPATKIVDTCPGCHRPVIIDLPVKSSHTAASVTSPVIHAILHGHSLKDLAHIEKLAEIFRITEILRKVITGSSVGCRILLVFLHHPGKNIPVFFFRKALYCFQTREGLETKFRTEPEIMLLIIRKRLLAMPYIPVVTVPPVLIIRLIKTTPGTRRRLPKRSRCLPLSLLLAPHAQTFLCSPHEDNSTHSAPPASDPRQIPSRYFRTTVQRCMMTETFYIFCNFLRDILFKFFCKIINITSKHQILPYDQPHLVTEIIEMIRRIITATPHTDAVKIGTFTGFQKVLLKLALSGINTVLRNIISAHGKNLHAIDTERELFPQRSFSWLMVRVRRPMRFVIVSRTSPSSSRSSTVTLYNG